MALAQAQLQSGPSAWEHVSTRTISVLLVHVVARVALERAGLTLADVGRELDQRSRRVTRRPGDAKSDTPTGPGAPACDGGAG